LPRRLPPRRRVNSPEFQAITGAGVLQAISTNLTGCEDTNEWDVWLTNVSATITGTTVVPMLSSSTNGAVVFVTNPVVALTFTIAGGSAWGRL
jgi:hypothetical protein